MDDADYVAGLQDRAVESGISRITQEQQAIGQPECSECGDQIPEARRKAAPWARHCVPCLEILEAQRRHIRRA